MSEVKFLSHQKYMSDNDYTAFQVYANDETIPVGSNSILGGYVSKQIPPQMTESFVIRTKVLNRSIDVKIYWGDGTVELLKEHYVARYISDEQIDYVVSHTYQNSGKYIIEIWGKDYFSLFTTVNSLESNADTTQNLLCRCFDTDLPIALHITNISSFARNSQRLLNVRFPMYSGYNKVINFANCFRECHNLNTVYGLNREFYNVYAMSAMFQDCENLVDCDLVLPSIMGFDTGYSKLFYNCAKLSGDISKFFPAQGFLAQQVLFSRVFYGCQSLTGTVPSSLLWERYHQKWLYTAQAFKECNEDIRNQVPTSWGGTNSEIVIETPMSKQALDNYLEDFKTQISNSIEHINDLMSEISNSINTVLHVVSMPQANAFYLNKVYLYTGKSNKDYHNGTHYICSLVDGIYKWTELTIAETVDNISNLVGYYIDTDVYMTWQDPQDNSNASWSKTVIVRKLNDYPNAVYDGEIVATNTIRNQYQINPLIFNKINDNYKYTIFTYSNYGAVSSGVQIDPNDITWERLGQILSNSKSDLRDYFHIGDMIQNVNNWNNSGDMNDWEVVDIDTKNMVLITTTKVNINSTLQKYEIPEKPIALSKDKYFKPNGYIWGINDYTSSVIPDLISFLGDARYFVKNIEGYESLNHKYSLYVSQEDRVICKNNVTGEVFDIADEQGNAYMDFAFAQNYSPYFIKQGDSTSYAIANDNYIENWAIGLLNEITYNGETYLRINAALGDLLGSTSTSVNTKYYEINPYYLIGDISYGSNQYNGCYLDDMINNGNEIRNNVLQPYSFKNMISVTDDGNWEYNVIDANFERLVQKIKIPVNFGVYPNNQKYISRKFWLPSAYELGFSRRTSSNRTIEDLGYTFEYYKNTSVDGPDAKRVKPIGASLSNAIRYWTRDNCADSFAKQGIFIANGNYNTRFVNDTTGRAVVACCLGKPINLQEGLITSPMPTSINSNSFTFQFKSYCAIQDGSEIFFHLGEENQEKGISFIYSMEHQRFFFGIETTEEGATSNIPYLQKDISDLPKVNHLIYDYITLTFDSGLVKTFVNDKQVGSIQLEGQYIPYNVINAIYIYYNNMITDAKVWNRALTHLQVAQSTYNN